MKNIGIQKNKRLTKTDYAVAYLSMEIALEDGIKSFAGGLGVLAGDMLRAASKINFPMIGISLLNKKGYFKQDISKTGEQNERADKSEFSKLKLIKAKAIIKIGTEDVLVRAWKYDLRVEGGIETPIYFLDTDWPENSRENRNLSGWLYGGDREYRLKQEIILGRGGVKMIEALGYNRIEKIHLNEGHGALAAIELFLSSSGKNTLKKIASVRKKIVFTTHTPIPEAHDIFFGEVFFQHQPDFPRHLNGLIRNNEIDMTRLAMYFSGYDNAVSLEHWNTSRRLFKGFGLHSITNGVDSAFWTSSEFASLYDKYIKGWRDNNKRLTEAKSIPLEEISEAHKRAKLKLISFLNKKKSARFSQDVFTIVFARRFAPYKRPSFIFSDLKKLLKINSECGKIQLVFAGKAHPNDINGKDLIRETVELGKKISKNIPFIFLNDYNMQTAKLLVSGADLWLNNPLPPNEASGTSGMKAAHNGVPQLSTLDGWWPEGYYREKTGWAIRETRSGHNMYDVLGSEIIPMYYNENDKYSEIMRWAICLNASRFNSQRMLREYIRRAYKIKI